MSTCTSCRAALPESADFCPECGDRATTIADAASPALMTLGGLETIGSGATLDGRSSTKTALPAGARFADRYLIGEPLGMGGMGVVYRAEDEVTKRLIALKLIRADRLGGEREVQRLVDEGVTARDIRHENVVAVYDVGVADGQPYLSMEILEGRSLRDWLRERQADGADAPAGVVLQIAREILAGLAAAHAKGVIHRDLKPENVMLTRTPTASSAPLKILDFGIARAISASSDSGSGTGLGTPHYMAPEQITSADTAGPSADLYSLSVLLYEMLVGVLPQGHWQPPSGGRSDVSNALDDLIQRGLSNRPASRPQSAAEYSAALDGATSTRGNVLDDLDKITERWRGSVLRGRGKLPRRTQWIIAAVIVTLAALGGMDLAGDESFDESMDRDDSFVHAFDPGALEDGPGARALKPQDLSGTWHDGYGGAYRVRVDRRGSIKGSGTAVDGTPLSFVGELDGSELMYEIGAFGQLVATGGGFWDGSLSITFQTFDLYGNPTLAGAFSVVAD